MCIIKYDWLIAIYIFISLVCNVSFLIIINSAVREELSYLPFFFRHNCNKSPRKNILLVIMHSCTSSLVRAPPQLPLYPSPTTCVVYDFQHLIFGNSKSPDKFTGKPKIANHPTISQESLKHKSTFKFKLRTIYPSTRSMGHPDISPDSKNTHIRPSINKGF